MTAAAAAARQSTASVPPMLPPNTLLRLGDEDAEADEADEVRLPVEATAVDEGNEVEEGDEDDNDEYAHRLPV